MSVPYAVIRFARLTVKVLLAYAGLIVVLFIFQRDLMYHPSAHMLPPEQLGLADFSEITLATQDGEHIKAWAHVAKAGFPTVIYFHGNGGNLEGRLPILRELADAGYGVLAPSYRGYGGSSGNPTEKGLYADGRAAIVYARDAMNVRPEQMLVFGESLGSGVAVKMASETRVGWVVLQAPFTSTADRGQEVYWYVPAHLLMLDRFESLAHIADIHAPLLILHADNDRVIPLSHGRALFNAAKEPRRMRIFEGVGHDGFPPQEVVAEVRRFVGK